MTPIELERTLIWRDMDGSLYRVNDEALLESGLDILMYELSILGTSWVSYSMLKNATKKKHQH